MADVYPGNGPNGIKISASKNNDGFLSIWQSFNSSRPAPLSFSFAYSYASADGNWIVPPTVFNSAYAGLFSAQVIGFVSPVDNSTKFLVLFEHQTYNLNMTYVFLLFI
jgi:hypothetical protein